MSKVKPISPTEVQAKKNASIPDEVYQAFNELITKYWNGHYSQFKQEEVAELAAYNIAVARNMDVFNTRELYDNHWLDVEDHYRKAGWKVEFDKPAYCENYPATFKFSK